MSHEPTETELERAGLAVGSCRSEAVSRLVPALTAANAIRDKRIRDEAMEEAVRALEKFGYETGRQECCGRGVPNKYNTMEECCGNPDLVVRLDLAANAIRALKDKPDDPAPV